MAIVFPPGDREAPPPRGIQCRAAGMGGGCARARMLQLLISRRILTMGNTPDGFWRTIWQAQHAGRREWGDEARFQTQRTTNRMRASMQKELGPAAPPLVAGRLRAARVSVSPVVSSTLRFPATPSPRQMPLNLAHILAGTGNATPPARRASGVIMNARRRFSALARVTCSYDFYYIGQFALLRKRLAGSFLPARFLIRSTC